MYIDVIANGFGLSKLSVNKQNIVCFELHVYLYAYTYIGICTNRIMQRPSAYIDDQRSRMETFMERKCYLEYMVHLHLAKLTLEGKIR